MSTGDQSQYIRSKIAERGTRKAAQFMRDGFDRWAETTAPARSGGLEKEPLEESSLDGGRMTLRQARSHLDGMGYELEGGFLGADAEQVYNMAREFASFVGKVRNELPNVITALRSEDVPPELEAWAKWLADNLALIDGGLKLVGLGKGKLKGSASWASMGAAAYNAAKQIWEIYKLLRDNKQAVYILLTGADANPNGVNIGRTIATYLAKIPGLEMPAGMGKYKKSGSKKQMSCGCSGSSMYTRKVGSAAMYDMGTSTVRLGQDSGETSSSAQRKRDAMARGSASPYDKFLAQQIVKMKTSGPRLSPAEEIAHAAKKQSMGSAFPNQLRYLDHAKKQSKQIQDAAMASARGSASPYDRFLAQQIVHSKNAQSVVHAAKKQSMGSAFPNQLRYLDHAKKQSKQIQDAAMASARGSAKTRKAPSVRGEIVKRVMREQGLKLPDASKYVKDHGLY